MVIDFQKPLWLLLIPIALLFVLYTSSRYMNRMFKLRKRLITIARSTVFILLILALAGVHIKWIIDTTTTLFVLDASDSMYANRQRVESFVVDALKRKTNKDHAGIIAFGDNSLIESFVSKDIRFSQIETSPNGMHTNIENALTTAMSMLPQDSKKRIVLISDGEENVGNSSKLASSILEQGIDLKVLKLQRDLQNEVAVDHIHVPQKLSIGEEFTIVVQITSNVKTNAVLKLISGRNSVSEERVALQKGNNRFVFRDKSESGGFKSYRVLIEPDIDTETRNNEASAFTEVLDKPKVLVLEDEKGEGDEIVKMLQASEIEYKRVWAQNAPSTLEELAGYKSIISCNVSAENFNEGFLNALESYVRDLGGGFIATGGENSFALGGYYKTPLEKVLPVNMDLKGKKEIPDMAIVLIIDKSGSMTEGRGGITRLDLAKEAAARTLDSLRPKDYIGVLTFDDTNYWVVETKKAEDPDAIREDIGTIRPGGGTSIIPALEEGYESIKKVNTKIKHMILLTDGIAERTGYEELTAKIKKDGITVSTVAIGDGSDNQLLESIAEGASGRFYYTDEFSNLPRIFAKETFMAARAYLNNRVFTPIITSAHAVLSGVAEDGLPKLLGYIGATPKDTARMVLASDEDDPILTVWQYGLGKAAAWNSDVSGKWSANYINWSRNINLWQNLINWTIEKYSQEDLLVETGVEGSKGIITVQNTKNLKHSLTKATILSPTMGSREIELHPIAPGKYTGGFDINETGAYLIKVLQESEGEAVAAVSSGISVQYSPEYRLQGSSQQLDRLIAEAGATLIESPEDVYKGKIKEKLGIVDLTPFLLIAALIIFMLDIALRRLNLPLHKLEVWLEDRKKRYFVKKEEPILKSIQVKRKENQETLKSEPNQGIKEVESREEIVDKVKKSDETKPQKLDTSALLKKKKNRDV